MIDRFAELTMNFFQKAEIFPGSLGKFRFRCKRTGKMGQGSLEVWVYEDICFELAQHIESAVFSWTEEGVADLRIWLNERYEARMGGTGVRTE